MHLKPVDWAIVRELMRWEGNQPQGALRFPVADIARRTRTHPNTVRARLAALRTGGVVEGAVFDPWPRTVGLVRSGWMFTGFRPPAGRELDALLERFPSANGAPIGLDWMFPHFWEKSDGDAKKRAAMFARAVGAKHYERHFTSSDFPPIPADKLRLSPLDARLILALRRGAERSLAAVAKGLGISPRVAERRAKRLFDAGAGGMFPCLRLGRVEGMVCVHFLLREGDERGPQSLAKAFPDRIAGPWGKGINAGVMVPLASLDHAEQRRQEAERMPGIGRLEIFLYRDIAYSGAFADYLERHVAGQQAAVASA